MPSWRKRFPRQNRKTVGPLGINKCGLAVLTKSSRDRLLAQRGGKVSQRVMLGNDNPIVPRDLSVHTAKLRLAANWTVANFPRECPLWVSSRRDKASSSSSALCQKQTPVENCPQRRAVNRAN
jgi:hypothetical protein